MVSMFFDGLFFQRFFVALDALMVFNQTVPFLGVGKPPYCSRPS